MITNLQIPTYTHSSVYTCLKEQSSCECMISEKGLWYRWCNHLTQQYIAQGEKEMPSMGF